MTDNTETVPDWQEWLRRWDVMQTAYLPFRVVTICLLMSALVLAIYLAVSA